METIKKIAIFGATGMIGKPVTQELVNAGFDITVLTRDATRAATIFPSLKVKEVNVFDPFQVIKALDGQDAVYISLSPERKAGPQSLMTEREGLKIIVDACKHLGIGRIALLSSLVQRYEGMNGFHWWIFDMKNQALELLRFCGIPFSIFYASSFMETIQRDIIRGRSIMLVAGSVAPMWFIAAADYGKQVARAFQIADTHNQEYAIQGPQAFTWEEAAKLIREQSRHSLTIRRAPLSLLRLLGYFNRTMNYGAHICEALNKYPERFESEKTWADLGRPTTTLQQFIADNQL